MAFAYGTLVDVPLTRQKAATFAALLFRPPDVACVNGKVFYRRYGKDSFPHDGVAMARDVGRQRRAFSYVIHSVILQGRLQRLLQVSGNLSALDPQAAVIGFGEREQRQSSVPGDLAVEDGYPGQRGVANHDLAAHT